MIVWARSLPLAADAHVVRPTHEHRLSHVAASLIGIGLAGGLAGLLALPSDHGAPCDAQPGEAKIAPTSGHTGLEGSYELTVVSQGPQLAGKHAVGRLWLWQSSCRLVTENG